MKRKTIKKIKGVKPNIRYLNDMKKVLCDQKWAKTAPDFKLYYMYRGIKIKEGLKHNITIIPPKMLGKEFVKTKGHYHIGPYGEIYTVLKGEAIFLMQRKKNGAIRDAYYVKAKKGDFVIIPRQYAHITINPYSKELKTGDWSSVKSKSDYKSIERKGGACYFYTKSGWVKNKNYKKVPKLHYKKPKKLMPKNLAFLRGK